MKTTLIIILAFVLLGCGENKMAHIAVETKSSLSSTNVTDDTTVYDTTSITVNTHLGNSSFAIIDGNLWATGLNDYGQLGLGDTTQRTSLTDTGVIDVKSVHCGLDFTFIIKKDGTLWATGRNAGRLGLGDGDNKTTFTDTQQTNVKTVSCGEEQAFIIKTDGTLWATGNNGNGQSGLGDVSGVSVFTNTGMTNIISVSSGQSHSAIIDINGVLYGTGQGIHVGLVSNSTTFVTTGETASRVSCGTNFTLIIDKSGTVKGTGENTLGQLGLGDNVDKTTYVSTGVPAIAISSGNVHSALLKTDGSVFTTGNNFYGQLGIGTSGGGTDVNVFTDTGVDSNVVHCGKFHTITEKTDGILYSTGYNINGQLGIGSTTDTNVFTTTTETPDEYIYDNWRYLYNEDIVKNDNYRYVAFLPTSESPNIFATLTQISVVNELKPFDGQNITPAIFASPMTYKITGDEEFNAFTLAKVLATSVTYTFRDSLGALVKTDTRAIDVKRDENGILSDYPTTVTFYADKQMEAGSTVEISLTYSDDVELGDFIPNNTIDAGFTNLAFTHKIKDFNDYTPDAWGNIAESVKAIVTTFDVTMDFPLSNYDYAVSFNESISGKNVTIDASDSNGAVADGKTIFASLTRRVRVTNISANSVVKDDDIAPMASLKLSVQEIV